MKIIQNTTKTGLDLTEITDCPYTCLHCSNKVGWSWIEPKHDCSRPMFDKEGNKIVRTSEYNEALSPYQENQLRYERDDPNEV